MFQFQEFGAWLLLSVADMGTSCTQPGEPWRLILVIRVFRLIVLLGTITLQAE